jgi:predicted small lipoprotein YifL
MRTLIVTLVFALAACGVRGPPRPPKPPQQPSPDAAASDDTTAEDTTTLELIR